MAEWNFRLRATVDEQTGNITKMVVEPTETLAKDWAEWDAEHPYVPGVGREGTGESRESGPGRTGGGGRSERAEDVASRASDEAKEAEPRITSDMKDAASQVGGTMVGLDYAVKEPGSLTDKINEKIADAADKGQTVSPAEALSGIHDVNRYTMTASPANYTQTVKDAVSNLQSKGYQFDASRWKNTWGPGNPYRGLNTTVKTPDGRSVELQFHTPDSFDLKQSSHADYEEARLSTTSQDRVNELNARMEANAEALPVPPGALDLTSPTS